MKIRAAAISYAGQALQPKLLPGGEAQIPPVHHLGVVIGKANRGVRAGGEHRNPHEAVAQIGPQQGWNHNGDGNQQAAHSRSAGLFLMRLGTFFADVLADLKFTQAADDQRPDHQSGEQRGQAGKRSAESQITENPERRKVMEQL